MIHSTTMYSVTKEAVKNDEITEIHTDNLTLSDPHIQFKCNLKVNLYSKDRLRFCLKNNTILSIIYINIRIKFIFYLMKLN